MRVRGLPGTKFLATVAYLTPFGGSMNLFYRKRSIDLETSRNYNG